MDGEELVLLGDEVMDGRPRLCAGKDFSDPCGEHLLGELPVCEELGREGDFSGLELGPGLDGPLREDGGPVGQVAGELVLLVQVDVHGDGLHHPVGPVDHVGLAPLLDRHDLTFFLLQLDISSHPANGAKSLREVTLRVDPGRNVGEPQDLSPGLGVQQEGVGIHGGRGARETLKNVSGEVVGGQETEHC